MSDSAPACPKCGKPNIVETTKNVEKRPVSVKLGLGIFLLPYIFSWFTLRPGHSTIAKIFSFTWMLVLLGVMATQDGNQNPSTSASQAPAKKSKPQKTPEQIAAEEASCKKDLQCWAEKFTASASVYCKDNVQRLAKYDYEWTDGMLEMKFSHYRWKNINKGIVTYIGDKIKLQNGFGAWQNYVYECDYNPVNNAVLDVRGQPGHI